MVAKAKRMRHTVLPQILIVMDDLADQKTVVRGDLLSAMFIRGGSCVVTALFDSAI